MKCARRPSSVGFPSLTSRPAGRLVSIIEPPIAFVFDQTEASAEIHRPKRLDPRLEPGCLPLRTPAKGETRQSRVRLTALFAAENAAHFRRVGKRGTRFAGTRVGKPTRSR